MEKELLCQLSLTAAKARRTALQMVYDADSGHIGGSLSALDVLTVLYFTKMRIDVTNPQKQERDRFVLSKGHCTPALYPILAMRGFFPESHLKTFRDIDSNLSGHAEMKHVPGVDMSTGSLGQGLSAAVGMALGAKIDRSDARIYAMLGDGEIQEGQIWEAAMAAGHHKLDNLVAIVDNNNLQIDGTIQEIMSPYPIDEKLAAFGWNVLTIDGHDLAAISTAFDKAAAHKGAPTAIIAKTAKGKGVSFMENNVEWHGNTPSAEQFATAVAELDAKIAQLEGGK